MAVHPKLMIGAGFAIAGLGLVGAGAGATFTAQVSADTKISTGGIGLSLNGTTGSDLDIGIDGKNISSHFAPMSRELGLKNTGTLDMASTYVSLTASGCDGTDGALLAKALHVTLTEMTNDADKVLFDGALCSFVISNEKKGANTPPAHAGVGSQLPQALKAGQAIGYRIVIQPKDAAAGLPPEAHNTSTSVNLVFSGFDY